MTGIETLANAIIAQDKSQQAAAKAAGKAWKTALTEAEQLRDISSPLVGESYRAVLVAVCDAGTPRKLTVRDSDSYTSTLAHFTALCAERAATPSLSLQGSFIASQVAPATAGMSDDQKHDVMSAIIAGFRCLIRTGLTTFKGYWHDGLSAPALETWAGVLNPEGLREVQMGEVGKRNAYSLALQAIASLEQAKPALYTVNSDHDGSVRIFNSGGGIGCQSAHLTGQDWTTLSAEAYAALCQEKDLTSYLASGRLVIEKPADAAILLEVA
ncbi:hypothetical protein [Cobetia sp. QF-1]|uniref:hypothetical protein n=1 Tax=Cobetia sp. QF-1 TaxID=1969833 RepID=UPI000B545A98|nr:hypothetical protein [Cobetia sp. QF-1]